jgi:hypothetical protein
MTSHETPNRLADVLARKARGRRSQSSRPVAEKLAILDRMRASLEPLRRARKARKAGQPSPGSPRESSRR